MSQATLISQCKTCQFWESEPDDDCGECTRQFFDDSKIAADEYEGIDTTADFGCVQHEPRSRECDPETTSPNPVA